MEKKNTMLLTVIAVATLLVAVVGATFAYFSLTVEGGTSTTVVNTQAQTLPTITMTKGKENFGISVTAEDMALNKPGARWAMYTGDEDSTSNNASSGKNADENLYHWSATEVKYNLFNIKADTPTSSENDTLTYECPVTITLTVKNKVEELVEGDLILYLYSKDGDVLVSDPSSDGQDKTNDLIDDWKNDANTYLMEKTNGEQNHAENTKCSGERGCYDISKLFTLTDETKTLYTVVIVNAGSSVGNGTSVEASMKLVNSGDRDQSKLAGKDIRVTLTSQLDKGGCKVITKEATD